MAASLTEWSEDQLPTRKSWDKFPKLSEFKNWISSLAGSIQPREDNWIAL